MGHVATGHLAAGHMATGHTYAFGPHDWRPHGCRLAWLQAGMAAGWHGYRLAWLHAGIAAGRHGNRPAWLQAAWLRAGMTIGQRPRSKQVRNDLIRSGDYSSAKDSSMLAFHAEAVLLLADLCHGDAAANKVLCRTFISLNDVIARHIKVDELIKPSQLSAPSASLSLIQVKSAWLVYAQTPHWPPLNMMPP